jgi:DNA-binding CsgD family transcriptional regulator
MAVTTIVGRDAELDSLQAFLAAAERGPAALVISGEPGIGKTVLWEAVIEDARDRFARVLSCRGLEAEASFAFAGLSELLSGTLDEVVEALPGPRRRALEVALLLVEPGEQPPDAHAIGLALLDVLREFAQQGPVLIALDDVQWLDASSAAVLQVTMRRLREERIGILATVRAAPGLSMPFELESSFPGDRLTELSLEPLSLGALHGLLKERLGVELTRAELVWVQQASSGNPFFALELARQGTRRRPGQGTPVPDSLGTLLGERLAGLPTSTRDVLLIAAAAGRAPVDVITAAHANGDDANEALEPAIREGVIEIDASRIRFTHPLLASVCLEAASSRQRRAVHEALARAVVDVEEQVRHLALAAEGPDAGVASRLDEAAEHAAARGAPAAAAELCELAADLTPSPDAADNRRRRLEAAELHRLAGGRERAKELLEPLLAEAPSGPERADVLLGLVDTLWGDLTRMIELCDEALVEATGDDLRSARILAYRTGLYILKADFGPAVADAKAVLEKAERVGDPALLATAISRVASTEGYASGVPLELLERGVDIEDRHELALTYYSSPRYSLARLQMRLGEIDRPRAALEELESSAAGRGDEISRGMMLWALSNLEWMAGRWPQAHQHATAAYELTEQTQHSHARGWSGRVKTLVEADLGLVDQARASGEKGLAWALETSSPLFAIHAQAALGHLELALGNSEAAAERLRGLPGELLAGGGTDPALPLWADAVESLIAVGELDLAREYLDPFEANARRLGGGYALIGVARCRGLLAAASGDLATASEIHEAALAELDARSYPLERARTLLCLGSVHRQAKQKRRARDALEEALATFEQLGAPLWAEKARAELRRISGRGRASEEDLTEMEERVARLAANGRSNKEIAAELFVSVHTVSAHLSRAYRKLGIGSRTELAGRLVKPPSEAAETATGAAKPAG